MKQLLGILSGFAPGELAGADGWRVQWVGLPESAWAALSLLAVIAAMVWLTIRSYMREGDVPRRAMLALAAVRIAVIGGVVAMLAQPAIELERFHTDTSTVLVLVDDSMSMSLADPTDPTTRLDRLRAALGRDGGAVAQLHRDHSIWLMAFGTTSPGVSPRARLLGRWDPPNGDSRPTPEAPSRVSIRLAIGIATASGAWLVTWLGLGALRRRRLTRAGATPTPRLGLLIASAAVLLVGFAATTYAVNARRVALSLGTSAPATRPADVDVAAEVRRSLAELQASGFRTNLVGALRGGLSRLSGRRIAAIVLVTDGQETQHADDPRRLAGIRELFALRGVRLITVCVGEPTPRPNLRIASVTLPPQVRLGASTQARVALEGVNCSGQTTTVRLFRQDQSATEWTDTGTATEVELPVATAGPDGAERSTTVVTLPLVCDRMGEFTYRAVVDPLAGEPITHDNAKRARLTVSDARVRVLLISADAGWEFQYLRNHLLRHPDRYQVSVWQQNADVAFSQQASTGMRLTSLPRTLAELADRFDAVLLYDPAHTTGGFDATFTRLLGEFVSTHRGGVGYIASGMHTRDNLAASGPFGDLVAILPVRVGRDAPRVSAQIGRDTRLGWPVRLTGAGRDHEITQLAADRERNTRVWDQLPGIFWSHPVESIKPAAVTLAVSGDPARVSADSMPLPLVVTHIYGRGPVLYVGFDGTWRWRYVQQGRYFRRFWSNAIDYLASYRRLKRRIVLTAGGDTFTAGEPIRLTAEAYDEDLQPWAEDTFGARLADAAGDEVEDYSLQRAKPAGAAGALPIYGRTITVTRPGEYRLTAPGMPTDDVLAATIAVVLPTEEFDRPEANPALLAELTADAGDAITLNEFDTLAARIDPDRRRVVELTTVDLWNVPMALAVLATLLTAEWIGRKRYNMA